MQLLCRRLVLVGAIVMCLGVVCYTIARSRSDTLDVYFRWTLPPHPENTGSNESKDIRPPAFHAKSQSDEKRLGTTKEHRTVDVAPPRPQMDAKRQFMPQVERSSQKKHTKPHCSVNDALQTTREWHRPIYRKFPKGTKSYKQLMRLNGTVFSGGFSNVLLIITRAQAHVLKYLYSAYKPYFWDILFLQPRRFAERDQAKFITKGIAVEMCYDLPHLERCPGKKAAWCQPDCPLDGNGNCMDAMYNCVSRILPLLLETPVIDIPNTTIGAKIRTSGRDALDGALVIHADAWVAPWFGKGLNLRNLIHVTSDTAMCYSGEFTRQLTEATDRVAAEFADLGQLPTTAGCSCRAWFDLYYLPRGAWLVWSRAAKAIGQRTALPLPKAWGPLVLWNEDALPLSFHVASKFGECQPEGGCKLQKMDCWGGAGPETPQTMITVMYQACGHKIDFGAHWHEEKFLELWQKIHKEASPKEGF